MSVDTTAVLIRNKNTSGKIAILEQILTGVDILLHSKWSTIAVSD